MSLIPKGYKENVLTHWMMDAHQDKMCLTQSVSNNLIPGKVFIYLQYV